MSHPVNDEILERLYEEVKSMNLNENMILFDVTKEVMKRFEELPEPLDLSKS